MALRTILIVSALWLIVAIVWASQSVLAANLQGNAVAVSDALRTAFVQTLPWIPVTLAIVLLTHRFPVTHGTWRRTLPVHLLAFPLLLYIENMLVVLGFWASQGAFRGIIPLLTGARMWTLSRLHVGALVYIAVAALTQGIAWYRRSRARELDLARIEGQLARARLDALTAQIRPHFLFNTLHTIGQLWRSGRAEEADAMLDHLGALFQRVQESTSRTLVSLAEELETVQAYLAIEAVRFRDRMRVEIHVDDAARGCTVPPLLLQPIVENAVRHGIAVSSAAGRIAVSGRVVHDRLVVHVEDDGPGMSGNSGRSGGTGLSNTRERLAQLFGDDHRLDIGSASGRGTSVRIELPARTATNGEDRRAPLEPTHAHRS